MAKQYDIIILTDKRYLMDSETNTYKHNVFYEDLLVQQALNKLGLKTLRLAWDDAKFDWSSTKAVVFRTTWDYFDRFEEFSKWLTEVSKQTLLFNSESIIRWNIDKHYLNDLKKNGVNITETYFIEQFSTKTLKELYNQLGWHDMILKPCISGAARHTYRLNTLNLQSHESILSALIKNEAMMLQPFQHNIVLDGEISMMVFNGVFTHAILKKAKSGDFRVQDDFGGSVHGYTPTHEEIIFSENAVKACPELPIYARVDIFTDNQGNIALSELELIEPALWFRYHPEAANVLARAIMIKLTDED
jgi:glutathione synthase/RimK-type ligase-like ATP-grasp enzyme